MDDGTTAGRKAAARVGLISDTHGHLRASVFEALAGVERVIHAGDVEDPDHLTDLEVIAPVTAVAGNVDRHSVRAVAPDEVQVDVALLVGAALGFLAGIGQLVFVFGGV